MTLFAKAVTLATVAVLTAGCLDVDVRTTIRYDGSGESHVTVTVASEVLGIMSLDGDQSPAELCIEMWADWSEGEWGVNGTGEPSAASWELTPNGECSMAFADEWDAAESEQRLRELGIARTDGGGYRYESPDTGPPAMRLADDGEELGVLLSELLGDNAVPEVALSITMPGGSVAHNADEAAEECGKTTFSWSSDLLSLGLAAALEAETDGDESSGCDQPSTAVSEVAILAAAFLVAFAFVLCIYLSLRQVEDVGHEPLTDVQRGTEAPEIDREGQAADAADDV